MLRQLTTRRHYSGPPAWGGRALVAAALTSALAGCASVAQPPAAPRLVCEDGSRLAVSFDAATDRAVLVTGDSRHPLARLPSGSGARYGDGDMELWIKGDEAMLTRERAHVACRFED